MLDYRKELAALVADTVIAQDTDALAADFQLGRAGNLVRITIVATADVFVLVPNSGSAIELNNGGALTADGVYTEELALDQGRTWNLQTPNAGGATIKHLCIQEVQA